MDDARLRQLAQQTGIPIKKIAEWHFIHAPSFYSKHKRKERPAGSLSIGDIEAKYGIPISTLVEWRAAGLKSRRKGQMALINEADLKAWLKEHPFVQRPPGRPRRSCDFVAGRAPASGKGRLRAESTRLSLSKVQATPVKRAAARLLGLI